MTKEYCEWEVTISSTNNQSRWVYYKDMGCLPHTQYDNSSFHFTKDEQENFLKFCPYCGKEIKIVGCK